MTRVATTETCHVRRRADGAWETAPLGTDRFTVCPVSDVSETMAGAVRAFNYFHQGDAA